MFAGGVLWGSTPRLFSRAVSAGVLDLIHSDLCGPMLVVSLRGYVYSVTFIDDHSRKTWIYFRRARNLRRSCRGSKSSKLLWRTRQGGRYRLSDWITGVSIPLSISMGIAKRRTSGGS